MRKKKSEIDNELLLAGYLYWLKLLLIIFDARKKQKILNYYLSAQGTNPICKIYIHRSTKRDACATCPVKGKQRYPYCQHNPMKVSYSSLYVDRYFGRPPSIDSVLACCDMCMYMKRLIDKRNKKGKVIATNNPR